jgi:Arc/MetJ-type ribon-helix-helix transcriptional regulator
MLQNDTYLITCVIYLFIDCVFFWWFILNVILKGKAKQILESMVNKGYANSLSEAIRLAIVYFEKDYLSEEEKVNRKITKMDLEIQSGKKKLLNAKEALGKYSKFLKK